MRKLLLSCAVMLGGFAAAPVVAIAEPIVGANPLPIDYFAIRETVKSLSLSPSGKYVAMLKITTKEGNPYIEIYDTDDFSKVYRRLDAKPMEFIGIQWVNDEYLFGQSSKIVRKSVKRPEADVRSYLAFSYSLKDNKFRNIDGNFGLENVLPNEADQILIREGNAIDGASDDDPFARFRPSSYYRFNIKKGTKRLVLKGNEKFPQASFNLKGEPVFTSGFDRSAKEVVNYYRGPGDKDWVEFARVNADSSDLFLNDITYEGTKSGDPYTAYVTANNGANTKGLWEFDLRNGEFGKLVYRNKEADVLATVSHTLSWAGRDDITAVVYPGAKYERRWLDQEEKRLHEKMMSAIPNAHQLSISSRSKDGDTMVIFNRGPKDPGTYYLIKNNKAKKLGSQNPLLKPADLANVEFIKYPARDGRMIPAYITKPNTPGPHPLVVLPHGGPYVNEVITYDEWGQLLANNGYMVLQPQYRGSTGWGNDHFMASWNQHGLGMQDDKDDGAKYLVSKGLVDADRMAMFGWSYGGYAALVAASRTPQLYQCVVAGAPVADAKKQYIGRKDDSLKFADDLSRQRGGYSGINPINEVEKVNVPMLFVHGVVDRRVMFYHFKDYKKKIEPLGKDVQWLPLKKADHFSNTLYYNHQKEFYTKLIDFLANDCGPNGL
ncbi:MAG: alpha/beta hydrolase family protein [Maricaulaceae bacterium]